MVGTGIMASMEMGRICTLTYPIEKVRNFSYPYLINVRILHQNGNKFGLYSRGRIYLQFLIINISINHLLMHVPLLKFQIYLF